MDGLVSCALACDLHIKRSCGFCDKGKDELPHGLPDSSSPALDTDVPC